MKKRNIIGIIIILVVIIVGIVILITNNKTNIEDENTLYSIKFDNTILRFERYDYVSGQNQLVGVQKSTNNGKDFEDVSKEGITVSMEPKFIFLNEKLGFAIKKPNNKKDNNKYHGMYVTKDGGKTFILSEINYDNPNIEILTIEDVPYYEDNDLKLHCSIYQVKEDNSGYEDIDLYFISKDDGVTWNLEK